MTDDKRIHVSAQASLVAFSALAVGLTDAALIATRRLGAAGAFEYVPQRVWVAAPLCWALVAMVFALVAYPFTGRRGGAWTAGAVVHDAIVVQDGTVIHAFIFRGAPKRPGSLQKHRQELVHRLLPRLPADHPLRRAAAPQVALLLS